MIIVYVIIKMQQLMMGTLHVAHNVQLNKSKQNVYVIFLHSCVNLFKQSPLKMC